jgi:hypothetical protein
MSAATTQPGHRGTTGPHRPQPQPTADTEDRDDRDRTAELKRLRYNNDKYLCRVLVPTPTREQEVQGSRRVT